MLITLYKLLSYLYICNLKFLKMKLEFHVRYFFLFLDKLFNIGKNK